MKTPLDTSAGPLPMAFVEPNLNKYNKYSILFGLEGKISEHSLEAQGNVSYGPVCKIFILNALASNKGSGKSVHMHRLT